MTETATPINLSCALPDEAATLALGAKLAPRLRVGDVIFLDGELGAGKTTLSRGLIQALCGVQEVPSPTYTLLQTYAAPDFEIWHYDLYRIKSPSEIWALGIEDALYDGVSLIEWPERLGDLAPDGVINIHIGFEGEGRIAAMTIPPHAAERFHDL